uniref:NADH-ubiquinone oxidoreductase chain 6 n=1 Tax=Chrysopogon zizanioides TaxID=167337 RepID=A0A7T3RB62_9POAL|nr:hypothetical protein KQ334_mgp041 [Chrysopogon zizanioides]QPZ94354.1 hypothetical protein [Chrysopogon zizanioides]
MRLLAPAFKFHFKEGRRTMILSVLSSPALVSGLMVVRAKNPVHSVLFPILVFCDTSGLLILLGLDFSAMIFPVVHIGAIAVSFLFVDSNSRRSISPFGHRSCNSIYISFYFYLPIQISRIVFGLSFYFLTVKLFLLLLNFFAYPLFAPEALVFASSYSEASAPATSSNMNLMDDLSRAVAPFLPRGGGAPVTLPEERPLTMEEEDRLALVLDYQNQIGALLKSLDITWLWCHHFDKESNEDLAAATLLHKDAELNDPDKLWVVHEGLLRNKHSSRYYFRAIDWVRTERKVRNGELPLTFIIDDDGEG